MALEKIRNQRGFTLVEMAIVLVIIGLILGAVIKGKDVMNSAKQKKFYTTFVKGWELTVASYYDRTGQLLGDGEANGGNSGASPNGAFDFTAGNGLTGKIKEVGLTPVETNLPGKSGQYQYTGTYSGPQTITLALNWANSAKESKNYNVLHFTSMPTDLAIAIDTMIDGQTGSGTGNWRRVPDDGPWDDASTTTTTNAMYIVNLP